MTRKNIERYKKMLENKDAPQVLGWVLKTFPPGRVAVATSFGAEDQVLTDMVASLGKLLRFFTLDTGRHFQETYDTLQQTKERYGLTCEVFFPDAHRVERLVNEQGPNLFYKSVEMRKACCGVRKIEPLRRALKGMKAWITGLRREQSLTRGNTEVLSWDEENGLYKICPIYNWTEEMVWRYIRDHHVPYNPLHDRGFRSVGCAPCTRAVGSKEDIRAGRWWWERPEQRECGLHKVKK